jgi:hypothetical protein
MIFPTYENKIRRKRGKEKWQKKKKTQKEVAPPPPSPPSVVGLDRVAPMTVSQNNLIFKKG